MKKKHFGAIMQKCLLSILITILNIAAINIYAQTPKLCGTYKINTNELNKALQFEKASKTPGLQHYLIRVYFHIAEYNDGSHAGATETDIDNEFANLQSDYASGNICFLKAGVDHIRNSALDTAKDDGSIPSILSNYNVPGCINIYYLYFIKGDNGNCNCGIGGDAFAIPNTFCIVAKGNLGSSHTTSHETGHCIGLLHPFDHHFGYEDIDGSNSAATGDLVQDTHADPYAYNLQSCFAVTGKVYTGNCTDPKGKTNFSPPYTNTMAYWWVYGYQNLFITSGQFTRINSYLNTTTILQACESPATYTLGPNVIRNSNYFMSSAITTYTTTGSVILGGSVTATLGGETVDLKPGFDANAYSGANITIKASDCNYTSEFVHKNNSLVQTDESVPNNLIAYPNPTSSIVHLDFAINKDEQAISMQVFNMQLQKVEEIRLGNLIKGKQSMSVNLGKQPSGVYYVFIQLQDKKLTAKVSLIK